MREKQQGKEEETRNESESRAEKSKHLLELLVTRTGLTNKSRNNPSRKHNAVNGRQKTETAEG